ncbi:3-deoxy-manno-octulosonate cytidylyltransferase [Mangrovibacterium marinum]|uniref:3-deoxy-manno-octulosonate cytidylyltransferase n=1 Tax=Mangrovibacterium marinum TaxID=1639118 RepID=A0A2T5C247_9BACT|nr:3-deoxy-manno-octulosonate cytidylyltransferase [Mangrovibacterium marinum]PTN08763.1 3-deoxy-manno-octulosonate cytidylyltransferase (CMP-KDO synthetase) [Mangrovibacterium marinum]
MKFIAIIPARYQSTRFPGKPLALLAGKPIIQHVYENAKKSVDQVWVATDDERIAATVTAFGGQYVMTNPDHPSGTDRCAEAARTIAQETDFDVIINIQGDEPFVCDAQLEALKQCFEDPNTEIATLVKKIEQEEVLFNPNRPKVVFNADRYALLFSRSTIPYIRGKAENEWLASHSFYSHLGMYAYRADVLPQLTQLQPSSLELAESLEQLRWLENGYKIKIAVTEFESIGIDTPEDLEQAKLFLEQRNRS